MKIHPSINHISGVVTVTLQAQFIGDTTDAADSVKIKAYGDPKVNLGGDFTDGADPTFTFSLGSSAVFVGITQEMHNNAVQFMVALPKAEPGKPIPAQGPLQVVTPDPVRAASVWKDGVIARIQASMITLRAYPSPLTTLPDVTV
jgi:hypothetical protein